MSRRRNGTLGFYRVYSDDEQVLVVFLEIFGGDLIRDGGKGGEGFGSNGMGETESEKREQRSAGAPNLCNSEADSGKNDLLYT